MQMEIIKIEKTSLCVIGQLGSTEDGEGFIQYLWQEANARFPEIAYLVKKDEQGNPIALYGAMSDFSGSLAPWEDGYSKGLYLAGAEVSEDAEAPDGWVKWTIPAHEYLCVKGSGGELFSRTIAYMKENALPLIAGVHELYCPQENGQSYLLFPIG